MATSRYDVSPARNNNNNNDTDARTSSAGNSNSTGAQTSTSTGSQTSTTDQTQTTNTSTQNMTSAQLQALNNLITMLQGGGSAEMRFKAGERRGEVQTIQDERSGFTKEAAFGDAQGLISQQMRRTLEALMPSINRAAEDAGSSGGALRALLMQDAANKAAESSSALGVQTAVNYGNVNANLSQVIERLTAGGDPAMEMLVQALNAAKGSVSNTQGTVTTQGTQTQNSSQIGTQNTNNSQTTNENKAVDYAPFEVTNNTPQFFGASDSLVDPSKYVGTTLDNLAQLNGTASPWRAYTF